MRSLNKNLNIISRLKDKIRALNKENKKLKNIIRKNAKLNNRKTHF